VRGLVGLTPFDPPAPSFPPLPTAHRYLLIVFLRAILVPRLRLGTRCRRGSASIFAGSALNSLARQAEPARHCVPRRSLGTRCVDTNETGEGLG